ncbi:hypothetical protein HMPREF0591_4812 [Mycobacterium parascrofulaceum ATCC BAA-614]|uniref:Head-to-tail stopper n=1 Tax=Mycobacterium parascrofulaceum ATCC BAA-614 TaxID=525368 RepID=D5PF68_9MYCO|nr:hypothetical protein [Mycobacterium parascrofulaceum]EFG75249.1 hypothetical protein HMPREF0591_4812 [Mycobacterium parascrofulaceum ATCC BAA-614]
MTEQVIRHRGAFRDENGKWNPGSDDPLDAIAVAPGVYPAPQSQSRTSTGRRGEDLGAVVYFPLGTDLTDDDELTVRDTRYRIVVNVWEMNGQGGLEVACSAGMG